MDAHIILTRCTCEDHLRNRAISENIHFHISVNATYIGNNNMLARRSSGHRGVQTLHLNRIKYVQVGDGRADVMSVV